MLPAHYLDVLARLKGRQTQPSGVDWKFRCPAHDDEHQSLSVRFCEGGHLLFKCHANKGCTFQGICKALGVGPEQCFFDYKDKRNGRVAKLDEPHNDNVTLPPEEPRRPLEIVCTYDYKDEAGKLIYQAVRVRPEKEGQEKDFRQRRPDGDDRWAWNLQGVRLVPYNLPGLLAADPKRVCFVVEGEKDVDTLVNKLGLIATTNVCGAGKWQDAYGEFLRGRDVVVLADNDDAGHAHAWQVGKSLTGVAARVKVIYELPNVGPKGDVTDWINKMPRGATKEEILKRLNDIITRTLPFSPTSGMVPIAVVLGRFARASRARLDRLHAEKKVAGLTDGLGLVRVQYLRLEQLVVAGNCKGPDLLDRLAELAAACELVSDDLKLARR
jgi:5S rRNA maturation endonuclease (ribonuclease M5)